MTPETSMLKRRSRCLLIPPPPPSKKRRRADQEALEVSTCSSFMADIEASLSFPDLPQADALCQPKLAMRREKRDDNVGGSVMIPTKSSVHFFLEGPKTFSPSHQTREEAPTTNTRVARLVTPSKEDETDGRAFTVARRPLSES
jgi:hypothetical protein